ncbi:DUF1413 domain-containing protein [Corallococcus exiguus]|uniref:DUF1413 domain-containing protein n=1 Tax=Corallococcus exiguus TaxID=83462 RepID=UPI001494649E|nr:DUF1413 domain-containing protein [Corallococcus exiguus]NPC76060.1 DUF1413 domain-containing protein [Corallococcus exiguus]
MSARTKVVVAGAIVTFRSKPAGFEFQLSELFAATSWSAIRVGVRRSAGTAFLKWAYQHPEEIECLGKDDENHQHYRKIC